MGYWACAQLEPNRTALALHCLGINGFEVYCPRLREQRRSRSGRKMVVTPPLFPGYTFVLVVSGWWDARWSPGVVRLIMDGKNIFLRPLPLDPLRYFLRSTVGKYYRQVRRRG